MLNLALCYEQEGKLASAWSRFLEVAAKARAAGQTDRARIGKERAAALAPKLSNIVVDVPPGSRVEGLEIRRDGVPVDQAEWGAAIPADAGPHTIEASAPNRKPWSQTITVADGASTMRVAVGELAPLEAEPDRTTARAPAASPTSPPSAPLIGASTDEGTQGPNGLKIAAVVTGGAGVAGIGVGAVFGALALAKHNEAVNACPSSFGRTCPTKPGADAWNDAIGLGDVSTVAFIAGGVAVAAGVVLWLVAPKHVENAPAAQLTVGPGAIDVRGTW
jgi:hypothetical protein